MNATIIVYLLFDYSIQISLLDIDWTDLLWVFRAIVIIEMNYSVTFYKIT